MKICSVVKTGLGLSLLLIVNLANAAWVASIDQFSIDQNGSTVVNDDFSTPGSTPYNLNFPLGYSGGRGLIGSQSTPLGISGISARERYFQRARSTQWLGQNDTFLVSSIFDIVTPDGSGRYGIRLTDQCGTCTNNDVVDLGLRFTNSGTNVSYRYNNDVRNPATANGFDFVQNIGVNDLSAFSQISLFLRNDGDGIIDAGFLFLDALTPFDLATMYDSINWFGTGYSMFNGESRVRGEFYNTEIVTVSEPSAYLLFGMGLLALGFFVRRRNLKL